MPRIEEDKDTRVRMLAGTFHAEYGDLHLGEEYLVTPSAAKRWVNVGDAEYVVSDAPEEPKTPRAYRSTVRGGLSE